MLDFGGRPFYFVTCESFCQVSRLWVRFSLRFVRPIFIILIPITIRVGAASTTKIENKHQDADMTYLVMMAMINGQAKTVVQALRLVLEDG